MEYRVKIVGGIQSCYVSLPLSLIQHLDSSRYSSPLSHFVALELRPSAFSNHHPWRVAWSGSASSSTDIEVAQEFAECLGIPDGITVLVRALSNLPKATTVTIEPCSEDDWEVLELNAEAAEAAMLNQVRIVHDAMRFPLWLHGQTIVTFLVVSTDPEKAVVQLVPGSEVAVVPKRRGKNNSEDSHMQSKCWAYSKELTLLRVQDSKKLLIHKSTAGDVDIGIELSSVALIHPNMGQKYSFEPLQVVRIMSRLSSKEKVDSAWKDDALRKKSSPSKGEANDLTSEHEQVCRYAVVRILFSDKVAKGHIMVSQSLCCYLRADLHSWLYVQRFVSGLKKTLPGFSVSPCQFVRIKQTKDPRNDGVEASDRQNMQNRALDFDSEAYIGIPDWSEYHELGSAFSGEFSNKNHKDSSTHPNAKSMVYSLLKVWYMGQCDAIKSFSGIEAATVVIGEKAFLHFDLMTSRADGKQRRSAIVPTDQKFKDDKVVNEILFVLSPLEEKGDERSWVYELSFGKDEHVHGLKFGLENVILRDPVSFGFVKKHAFGEQFVLTVSDLSWINGASNVTDRLMLLLSHASGSGYCEHVFPLPGHVLICGPSGSGKSLLASAVAKSLEESHLLVHIVYVRCSAWASKSVKTVRQKLHECLSEALDHPPSLIVFDDFDTLISSSLDSEGSATSSSITELISSVMDELEDSTLTSCEVASIAFMACVRSLDSIPQSLRTSGRFDFHIELPALAASGRIGILKHELQKRSLQCSDDILHLVALKCEGYDSYDLELLVHRSIHAATSRLSPSEMNFEGGRPILNAEDFMQGMDQFVPVSMRDVTKSTMDNGRLGWEDVGGLADVRTALIEMIEMPSKFPRIFSQSPLRMRSNVLLYGPPGCGKTHIVGAAAAASSLRFISIKGPELLNKYIGSSEQAVRDVFSKAAAAAPCLLFFDEFDSIAPKRGHDNTGVTDRVVNQFLTELDGVEVLSGVFVFAASSRPDLIDAALLRPGRLDRLLFCDLPSLEDRLDILTVLSRKLRFGDNVDLTAIAHMTEGFSGADLQALLSDAQLAAVQEVIDNADKLKSKVVPVITNEMLQQVVSKARPSVSDSEKQRLYSIYSQFSNSKRSVAAQSRDKKGKRATLA